MATPGTSTALGAIAAIIASGSNLSPLDAPEVVVTVIGWRRADGWHF